MLIGGGLALAQLENDVFHACTASVADTAQLLGISTANLVKFFQKDPKLWERVNQMRQSAGLKQLR